MRKIAQFLIKKILAFLLPYEFIIDRYSFTGRMSMSFSKGAINKASLTIDPAIPETWEFSAFSQNGEDGIVDFLLKHIKEPNKYFIEIGSSDGLENNSSYLAFVKKYNGIMIEGDSVKLQRAKKYLQRFNWGVKYICMFVTKENINLILTENSLHLNPDYFSLDIDGIDYYVMESILTNKFRPKIVCVEYNSSFGPTNAITINYDPNFSYWEAHSSHTYYGVSISGWRKLFAKFEYEFIAVDSNGVNVFFIDRKEFKETLPTKFKASDFIENFALRCRYKNTWVEQFEKIKELSYNEI